ncbi:capsid protein [Alces alces faeces associated circular virus MP65]|uniref:capsid protein n=1 Tax=Alces alces faeces associated circular virus MP65 TaxID=2219143 RepID=UPI000DF08462|nr:capsid protein [Alces alces faeces associated circular virus MP65]AXB22593.1 capsid protein [Alces alces faeces associated circular virus MP65]
MNQARRDRELALFQRGPDLWINRLASHTTRTDDPLGIKYEVGLPSTPREARLFVFQIFGQHRRTLPLVLKGLERELNGTAPFYPRMVSSQATALAQLWKNKKMPAKKSSRGGIGKAAKAKKNYGATPAFNRALTAAVQKVEARSQETTYSQSGVYLNAAQSTFTQTGYTLSGLNQSAAYAVGTTNTRANATNQVFAFPICPLAQVGNSSTPGYRKGQRINPVGFRFSIQHDQSLATMSATYKWALIRNQGGTLSGNTGPVITQTNAITMFVGLVQGPLASAGGPNGALPNGDFASSMRWNRQAWTVKKQGSYTMPAALARDNNTAPASATAPPFHNSSKTVTHFIPIRDSHWDYPTPTAIANIKGGDYYFVLWREGSADQFIGNDFINFICELSFKDP